MSDKITATVNAVSADVTKATAAVNAEVATGVSFFHKYRGVMEAVGALVIALLLVIILT